MLESTTGPKKQYITYKIDIKQKCKLQLLSSSVEYFILKLHTCIGVIL